MMWDHASLLRRALLLTSLLTLSGLHAQQDQQSACWRPALLLTLVPCLLGTASTTVFIFTAQTAWESIYGLAMAFTLYHALFLLGYFLYNRRRMLGLLRRAEELEHITSTCRQCRDHSVFRGKAALICVVTVSAMITWMAVVFSEVKLAHPNYILPAKLPQMMLTKSWYPVVMMLQTILSSVTLSLQIMFEMLLVGMADAARVFMARLGVFCQRHVSEDIGSGSTVLKPCGARVGNNDTTGGSTMAKDDRNPENRKSATKNSTSYTNNEYSSIDDVLHDGNNIGSFRKPNPLSAWSINCSPRFSPTLELTQPLTPSLEAPFSLASHKLEARLLLLTELCDQVRRFVEDADEFCSFPALSLHSSVAAGLLLGSYVSIILFSNGSAVPGIAVGFLVFEVSISYKW